jgi:hypothetical protein
MKFKHKMKILRISDVYIRIYIYKSSNALDIKYKKIVETKD